MFKHKFIFLISIVSLLITAACQSNTGQKTEASPEAKRYELVGRVVSVDPAARKAKIEHDEIKGYMPAMTMDFPIKQDWVLRELKPNDKIAGVMVVDKDASFWLENVSIAAVRREGSSNNEEALPESGKNLLGVEVPDFKLTNQEGKRFGFHDYRGKTLALTFIFTRCPDANMCPLMSINFSDLEKELRKSPELAESVRLLSISFDPEYDTPEVLKKYGAAYQGKDAKPNFDIWNLATGSAKEVKDVESFFGASAVKAEDNRLVHNLRTVIVDKEGKVAKVYAGNAWTTADLLKDLREIAEKQ